jgi:hypothetical protein
MLQVFYTVKHFYSREHTVEQRTPWRPLRERSAWPLRTSWPSPLVSSPWRDLHSRWICYKYQLPTTLAATNFAWSDEPNKQMHITDAHTQSTHQHTGHSRERTQGENAHKARLCPTTESLRDDNTSESRPGDVHSSCRGGRRLRRRQQRWPQRAWHGGGSRAQAERKQGDWRKRFVQCLQTFLN